MSDMELEDIVEIPLVHNYSDIYIQKWDCINYKQFFQDFMVRNVPCVIKQITSTWECTKKWVEDCHINYEYLMYKYGNLEAPVADCAKIEFNSQCKNFMKFGKYIEYLKGDRKEGLLYLKDWHLKRTLPKDNFYEIPQIFASDWLNEYAQDHQDDDFMFVYIGPKDSWTPLHADVYCSYSWSANVIGRKKWILFPPGEEEKLKDSLGHLPILFIPEKHKNVKYYEVIQEKGEAIFVPSGWHHQVVNIHDTISINHNWINACNINFTWKALQKSLLDVEVEIKEFRDTPEYVSQCQLILKSIFGMDFQAFINLISYIGKKRLIQLKENTLKFNNFIFGKKHIMLDLMNISKTIDSIHNHPLFNSLSIKEDLLNLKKSISQIDFY